MTEQGGFGAREEGVFPKGLLWGGEGFVVAGCHGTEDYGEPLLMSTGSRNYFSNKSRPRGRLNISDVFLASAGACGFYGLYDLFSLGLKVTVLDLVQVAQIGKQGAI